MSLFVPWTERTDLKAFYLERYSDKEPSPGDLVYCASWRGNPHDWVLAYYVETIPGGGLLREIGSDRLCRVTNEAFHIIHTDREELKFDRFKWVAFQKVMKSLSKSYGTCLYDMAFDDGRTATIRLRKRWNQEVAKTVVIKFYARTTIKSLRESLIIEEGK